MKSFRDYLNIVTEGHQSVSFSDNVHSMTESSGDTFTVDYTDQAMAYKLFIGNYHMENEFDNWVTRLVHDLYRAKGNAARSRLKKKVIDQANDFMDMHELYDYVFVDVDVTDPENPVWTLKDDDTPIYTGDVAESNDEDVTTSRLAQLAGIK